MQRQEYAPQDTWVRQTCVLTPSAPARVLRGPNESGKTSFLLQNASIAFLAHVGCFVPARKACIGLVDQMHIATAPPASSWVSEHGHQMRALGAMVKKATAASLLLIDQAGAYTSAHQGQHIVHRFLRHWHRMNRPRLLLSTYHPVVAQKAYIFSKRPQNSPS